MRGLIKSIGNGQTTKLWFEKWIMDEYPRALINHQSIIDLTLDVADLISPEAKWKTNRIHELFPPTEANRILKIPVGQVEDRFVWAYTSNDFYSIKSGYWFVSNNPIIPLPRNTPMEQVKLSLKQRIWKLETLPKICMFLWRVISSALAMADRLQTRGLHVNPMCKICNSNSETICHVLFYCPTAKLMLQIAHILAPINGFTASLEENMVYVLDLMERQNIREEIRFAIPWILWSIWKNRNAILYLDIQEVLETVI